MKNDHRSKFSNLSNWKEEAWKKFRASTGFEPVTSASPVRCSTNWAMKPHIGSEVNLLSSYLPWRVKWCEVYEIIHFWTAVVDESEEWSGYFLLEEQHENFLTAVTTWEMLAAINGRWKWAAVKKKVNKNTYDISSQKRVTKGLFTWRWGTPVRWGNPPVHVISHFNLVTFTW